MEHTKRQMPDVRRRTVLYIPTAVRTSECIAFWSFRTVHNKNKSSSKLCTIGLTSKEFEDIYLRAPPPSPERCVAGRRGKVYTNQLHNTNQMRAFLKDPNAINNYSTVRRWNSGFCVLVYPLFYFSNRPKLYIHEKTLLASIMYTKYKPTHMAVHIRR